MCKHIVLQSDFNFLNIKQPTDGVLLIIRILIYYQWQIIDS